MQVTNEKRVPLPLAVWVLHDEYDYIPGNRYISATTLMKPLRQIILNNRIPYEERTIDVSDLIKSAMGRALHDSIEKAWVKGAHSALTKLRYPERVINAVLVNPSHEQLAQTPDAIPVYIEQRMFRELNGWNIGGKFDMVAEGFVQDNKSTSAYTWLYGTKDDDYAEQGSIYRWIDAGQPYQKITEDLMLVNFIFTDWQKSQAKQNPKYPQNILEQKAIPLIPLDKMEARIAAKLKLIEKYENTPESQLPECTPDELWMGETVHKYFADPAKTDGRATKNFDSLAEANAYKQAKGKGVVKSVVGTPKRCEYCPVFEICSQKDKYFG